MKKDYWLYLAAAAGGAAVSIVITVLSIPSVATARLGA